LACGFSTSLFPEQIPGSYVQKGEDPIMAQISQQELDEIYAFALDIGKRAGKLLLDGVDKRIGGVDGSGELAFTEKDNAVDIVTKTDEGLLYNPFFTPVVLRRSISFLS
jgi:hypothetical protein